MAVEREVKLRFQSAEEARARVHGLGAIPLRSRRLQDDTLLDTEDDRLRARRVALRIRRDVGTSLITFKGAPHAGPMKLREEHETTVGDPQVLTTILQALGFRPWFRYQKYREEFALDGVVIAIDETPIGVFVEIEGSAERIAETAGALGSTPADYIVDSYRTLFVAYCDERGWPDADMVFRDDTTA